MKIKFAFLGLPSNWFAAAAELEDNDTFTFLYIVQQSPHTK